MSTFARKTSLTYVYDRTVSVYSEGESDATSRVFGMAEVLCAVLLQSVYTQQRTVGTEGQTRPRKRTERR